VNHSTVNKMCGYRMCRTGVRFPTTERLLILTVTLHQLRDSLSLISKRTYLERYKTAG